MLPHNKDMTDMDTFTEKIVNGKNKMKPSVRMVPR